MKTCPACYARLQPADYEGFKLFQCAGCKGHLVQFSRLEAIKRSTGKSRQKLKSEASSLFKGSTDRPLKCPRCHFAMRKVPLKLPVLDAQADVCNECSLVWLDPGELALIQLAFEASATFRDSDELKRRLRAVDADPQRKAQFEQNLAHLPETEGTSVSHGGDDLSSDFVKHGLWGVLLRILFRL